MTKEQVKALFPYYVKQCLEGCSRVKNQCYNPYCLMSRSYKGQDGLGKKEASMQVLEWLKKGQCRPVCLDEYKGPVLSMGVEYLDQACNELRMKVID